MQEQTKEISHFLEYYKHSVSDHDHKKWLSFYLFKPYLQADVRLVRKSSRYLHKQHSQP